MLVPDLLSAIYLICFLFGLVMLFLSLVTGLAHLPVHLGRFHLGGHAHGSHGDAASPFNVITILLFLTWFGGAGYLLHGPLGLWGGLSALLALPAGLLVAAISFEFLKRVLLPQSVALDPADFALIGQVGRLSVAIRPGGVGEVLYSQHGRRRALGARAVGGVALERGTEVVIVAVEHGLAQVEPWEQFVHQRSPAIGPPAQ